MKAPLPLQLDVLAEIPGGSERESRDVDEKQAALWPAFEEARRTYEDGDYRRAAWRFMAAARQARGGSAEEAIARNRVSCYRNAARSFYMAGAIAEGRALLEQAAREDPSTEPEIQQILDLLEGGI